MKMMGGKSLVALIAACAVGVASQAAQAQSNEVYGGVGTGGIVLGAGHSFDPYFGARAELGGFSLSHTFTSDSTDYDANLRLIHGSLFADFFPAASFVPVHLTAGVIFGGDQITGDAKAGAGGTYTINGVPVTPTAGETITAKLKWPTVRPYLGIGFGHNPVAKPGFSFAADIGVAFGKPSVTYNVPADLAQQAGAENVAAAEAKLQDKAKDLRFYPVVTVAVTYRFF